MKTYISIKWHTEDIQSVREDLTDEQANKVLDYLKDNHDASVGINWDVIEQAIEEVLEIKEQRI